MARDKKKKRTQTIQFAKETSKKHRSQTGIQISKRKANDTARDRIKKYRGP